MLTSEIKVSDDSLRRSCPVTLDDFQMDDKLLMGSGQGEEEEYKHKHLSWSYEYEATYECKQKFSVQTW